VQVLASNGREALDQESGCKLPLRNFIADVQHHVVDAVNNGTLATAIP
jgi:hypothetical protein